MQEMNEIQKKTGLFGLFYGQREKSESQIGTKQNYRDELPVVCQHDDQSGTSEVTSKKTVALKYVDEAIKTSSTVHGPFEEFSNDLLSILNDASSSDVTIKCGTEVLKAHKLILSARSHVFKTMFSTAMRESTEGTVAIDDIDPQVVRDMLTFIYSNQVQNVSVPKACDLLNAAEKYQLQALKNACVDFLMSNLSEAHAFLILQTADLYDEDLKLHAIEFIRDKFSDLKETEEWKTVQSQNPTLALEVFNKVVEYFY